MVKLKCLFFIDNLNIFNFKLNVLGDLGFFNLFFSLQLKERVENVSC